jgi:hypothetical protein
MIDEKAKGVAVIVAACMDAGSGGEGEIFLLEMINAIEELLGCRRRESMEVIGESLFDVLAFVEAPTGALWDISDAIFIDGSVVILY